MPSRPKPALNLRILILICALLSALATLANSFWVMFKVQKQELIANALVANGGNALRIATGIQQVLGSDLDRLKYSSGLISDAFGDRKRLVDEAQRLLGQDSSFNSVLIADAAGTVLASSPASLHLDGQALRDMAPLSRRIPMISDVFTSIAGNLIIFISQPVFDAKGSYLGLVGGSVQLDQGNTLQGLMDSNIRPDGAHVYLVDKARRVLVHPDTKRIGSTVGQDPIVDAALHGSGTFQALDANGVEMLAGFAKVPYSDWSVISQQPLTATLGMLQDTILKIAKGVVPLGVFGFLSLWWLATKISTPLSRLADCAKRLDTPDSYERISTIPAQYFESWQIRRALLLGAALLQEKIGRLNLQAQTDALTGLANRRAMQEALSLWQEAGKAFAVVSMDIDHFKRVNDTFGHGVGDETLRAVANLMKQNSRSNDLPCRVGGEEFILLLPESSLRTAIEVAERLRVSIETEAIDTVGHITISLGVALWRPGGVSVAAVLERADQLLYQAKQSGRNRVVAEKVAQGVQV